MTRDEIKAAIEDGRIKVGTFVYVINKEYPEEGHTRAEVAEMEEEEYAGYCTLRLVGIGFARDSEVSLADPTDAPIVKPGEKAWSRKAPECPSVSAEGWGCLLLAGHPGPCMWDLAPTPRPWPVPWEGAEVGDMVVWMDKDKGDIAERCGYYVETIERRHMCMVICEGGWVDWTLNDSSPVIILPIPHPDYKPEPEWRKVTIDVEVKRPNSADAYWLKFNDGEANFPMCGDTLRAALVTGTLPE